MFSTTQVQGGSVWGLCLVSMVRYFSGEDRHEVPVRFIGESLRTQVCTATGGLGDDSIQLSTEVGAKCRRELGAQLAKPLLPFCE